MTNNTLEALEVKIAFLEDALTKLSDEHYHQQKELDALKLRFEALLERVAEDGQVAGASGHEKPPHY